MVLLNIIIVFFLTVFTGLFLVKFLARLQTFLKYQMQACCAITYTCFYFCVSIWCKYHQVLQQKIWILYCKVVTNLFTGVKEDVLVNNFLTKNILHTKNGHCISNAFAVSWYTVRKLNCLTAVDINRIAIYFCVGTMHYHFESTDLHFQRCTFV